MTLLNVFEFKHGPGHFSLENGFEIRSYEEILSSAVQSNGIGQCARA